MADNVAITAGTGTTVSTEEITTLNGGAVSAQHIQRVANALRTADGVAIDLPGDAANGLDVDVTRIPALTAQAAAGSTPHAVVSLGNSQGKSVIGKPGSLASSAVTANQTVTGASWTVTAAKTGYLTHVDVGVRLTTFAATATLFGTASLRIGGTVIATWELAGSGFQYSAWLELAEPLPVSAGVVVDIVCTPAAVTAMTWKANIVGYEK